jgi:hypothetical protein
MQKNINQAKSQAKGSSTHAGSSGLKSEDEPLNTRSK